MRTMHAFGVLFLAAAAGVSCAAGSDVSLASAPGPAAAPAATAAAGPAALGASAPAFALEDQTGKKVSLSDYAGKVVVLEWINPDCPFVQRHAKAGTMRALSDKYKGQVVWLGVNSTSYMGRDNNAKWVADHGLAYPVLDDHAGEVGRLYGAKTTPHMYVIDTSGKLVYEGAIDDDPGGSGASKNYVDAALTEVLAGKPVSVGQTKSYGCSVKYAW